LINLVLFDSEYVYSFSVEPFVTALGKCWPEYIMLYSMSEYIVCWPEYTGVSYTPFFEEPSGYMPNARGFEGRISRFLLFFRLIFSPKR